MDVKTIELFGKTLFSWVTMDALVNMHTPMPENEAAFVYTLKGSGISYSETNELNIVADQSVLAKCGNSTFKTITYGGSDEYSAISIRFNKEVLEQIYNHTPSPFYKKADCPLSINSVLIEPNELLSQFSKGLIYYFDHPELLTDELLVVKLKELIILLLQTKGAPKVLEIMNNLFENKTFKFTEIIKAHICSSIHIEELAQLTNHSLSAFKKEFKRIYNDTPNNYIISQRIEKVAELLPISNDSISNIAYDCEFKTLAHMSRVFKAKYGISPTKYRQNLSDKR